MNKLKEINGKIYQRCEIIMLPTNKKATDKPFSTGITLCNDGKLRLGNPVGDSESRYELYVISFDKIVKGWKGVAYKNNVVGKIFKHFYTENSWYDDAKIVIASTDTQFNLPQPSKSFINAYINAFNSNIMITNVLVEKNTIIMKKSSINYEDNDIIVNGKIVESINYRLSDLIDETIEKYNKPRINDSNEIIIKKIKNNWTREEIIELCTKAWLNGAQLNDTNVSSAEQWINENLYSL